MRGDTTTGNAFVNTIIRADRPRALALAQKYGLALLGAAELGNAPQPEDVRTYDRILAALPQLATQSGRAELATAPLLLEGFSNGNCVAYGLTRLHSDRVAAMVLLKGGCESPVDAGGARSVPAYAFIGELDTESRRTNLTNAFEQNRAQGAVWALAIDRCQAHDPLRVEDVGRLYDWWDAVLALRLPHSVASGQQAVLPPIAESAGWLGDRSSYEVAAYASYAGDRLSATWLPNEATARDWHDMETRVCGV